MPFINSPLIESGISGEILETRMYRCNPDIHSMERFSRVTDGIDRYIAGIGTAISGLKSLAYGNDSSFDEAVLLDGEFWLDVDIPANFQLSSPETTNSSITIPAMRWLLRKTSSFRIEPEIGYVVDASNMLAIATFDRMALDDVDSDEFKFIPEVQELFDIHFNCYEVVTRASNLVSTMRDQNHGNPPKAYVVAQYPTKI